MSLSRDASDLLVVHALRKRYTRPLYRGVPEHTIDALAGANLTIRAGAIVGLIGGSGCGKSTLARCVTGLERPDAGQVILDGLDLLSLPPGEFRQRRRSIQLVFQDSAMALNPWFTLEEIIAEPLRIAGAQKYVRRKTARALMEQVGMPNAWLTRHAAELSGGQRQRIAIARALAAAPKLIVLDEPFSGMDTPLQAEMVELLRQVREDSNVSLIFISHDIEAAARFTSELAVMQDGRMVECGPTSAILSEPHHNYTRALLAAVPQWRAPLADPS